MKEVRLGTWKPSLGKIALVCVVLALLTCICLFAVPWIVNTADTYSGKQLFTQGEYESFKMALSSPEVTITEITVLSSNPILVQFQVKVPHGQTFSYGNLSTEDKYPWRQVANAFFIAMLVIVATGFPVVIWTLIVEP